MTERSCWYLLWDWGSSAPGVAPGVVLLAIVAPGVVLLAVVAPGVVLLAVVPAVDTDGAVPILALVWKKKKIKKNYTNYQVIIDQQIIFKILNKSFKLQSYLQYLRYAILGRSRCSGIVCWNLWWVCCWDWRCWLSRIMWCLTLLSRKGCKGLKSLTKKMYMSR